MPNGNPDFHLNEEPKLEAFFAPIADVLVDFARRHNLKLQKYYHQGSSWDFTFKHPHGGVGKIEAIPETGETLSLNCIEMGETLSLHCIWWHDDYDKMTRFSKHLKGESLLRESRVLREALENSLMTILSWQFGQWDDKYSGFNDWKRHWTKTQFDSQLNLYPILKI